MKRVLICGILSLFIGGIAIASSSSFNVQTAASHEVAALDGDVEVIGSGVDAGGFYVIVSTDTQCKKVYPDNSGNGMFDH